MTELFQARGRHAVRREEKVLEPGGGGRGARLSSVLEGECAVQGPAHLEAGSTSLWHLCLLASTLKVSLHIMSSLAANPGLYAAPLPLPSVGSGVCMYMGAGSQDPLIPELAYFPATFSSFLSHGSHDKYALFPVNRLRDVSRASLALWTSGLTESVVPGGIQGSLEIGTSDSLFKDDCWPHAGLCAS